MTDHEARMLLAEETEVGGKNAHAEIIRRTDEHLLVHSHFALAAIQRASTMEREAVAKWLEARVARGTAHRETATALQAAAIFIRNGDHLKDSTK